MRALRALFCAVVLTACLAPGVRADEYTKQTFLTFSGPVQLPGITLAAGTYQFKLADPESGRRTLQVWDKDGNKLYTTLLTIPDQRMKATDKPVVMFTETASGEAQPIRAWFYPNETYGMEFVYPKDQAMKIAQTTHSSVLSFDDNGQKDEAAYHSAKVGRVDENGHMTDADKAETTAANNTASPQAAQSASTTTSSAASTTTADKDASPSASTAPAQTAQNDRAVSSPAPSANRSDTSAPAAAPRATAPSAATTTSEANRDNMPQNRAVGTSGSATNNSSASQTAQAASGANAAARANTATGTSGTQNNARTLPQTASSATLIQLLAGLSLAAAFAVRAFRTRYASMR